MTFVTLSTKQAAQYSYMCECLIQVANKMNSARKTLETIANTSFDKSFAKCVYLFTSESLQCENEIRSQIDSLNLYNYENNHPKNDGKLVPVKNIHSIESLCNYCEEAYFDPYKKLLKDKNIGTSLKSLIQNHLQLLLSSLTQLKLFYDVKNVAF